MRVAQIGCGLAQIGWGVAQIGCGMAQAGCGVAQAGCGMDQIGVNKIFAPTKYWRRQNIGFDKISASTNIGVHKILAWANY